MNYSEFQNISGSKHLQTCNNNFEKGQIKISKVACPKTPSCPNLAPGLSKPNAEITQYLILLALPLGHYLFSFLFRRNTSTGQVPSYYKVWKIEKQRRLTEAMEGKKFLPMAVFFSSPQNPTAASY